MTPHEGGIAAAGHTKLQLHYNYTTVGSKRHQGHRRTHGGIKRDARRTGGHTGGAKGTRRTGGKHGGIGASRNFEKKISTGFFGGKLKGFNKLNNFIRTIAKCGPLIRSRLGARSI